MSETPVEIVDWDAIATQVIRELLGRRLTFPLMRAVDAYPPARELHLTGRPVKEIHAVHVVTPRTSTLLDPSKYQLGSRFRLRIHGSVALPYASYEPSACTNEIHVEYTYGSKPPPAIQQAINALTEQLELAAVNADDCKLPKRITSIASQGLNMTLLDPQDYLEKGLTGLPEVDAALSAFNPGKAKARSRLFTDRNPPARRLSVVAVEGSGGSEVTLRVNQGADFAHGWLVTYNGNPIDATWTARGQVRPSVGSSTLLHQFAASVNPDGSVVIAVAPEESSAWSWRSGVYDIEVVNADESITLRVASGFIYVSPEVTT